jgi:uncharacterized protein
MRLRNRRGANSRPVGSRVFFATDIHGSDVCFRKFLNAGKFYSATHLIMGGDITGKTLVTIRRDRDAWRTRFREHDYEVSTQVELDTLIQAIRDSGQYPFVGDRDELAALANEEYRNEVFTRVVTESMARWMDLAEERLANTGIRCYVTPGNDDFWEIDPVIQQAAAVEFVDGRCVELDDEHDMITTGYSNLTPWHTDREIPEDELEVKLEAMWTQVRDPANAIAVIHVPPRDTTLDEAPELSEDLSLQSSAGGLAMGHVGSTAVRSWLERAQPLCGFHGHVHESKATAHLGRTLCINPGSEYGEGILLGALVTLGDHKVDSYQLVSG